MPDVNVYETFKELVQRIMDGDQEVAELAASDPEGLLSAYGVTEGSLDGGEIRRAVAESYQDYELPEGGRQALESYVAGGSKPSHYQVQEPPQEDTAQSADQAAQHLQYVTYATHETNETVTREIVNQQFSVDRSDNRTFEVDNSTELDGLFLDSEVAVESRNVTAAGDGAVANDGTLVEDSRLTDTVLGDGNQTANVDIDAGGGRGGFGGDGTGGAARSGPGGDGGFAEAEAESQTPGSGQSVAPGFGSGDRNTATSEADASADGGGSVARGGTGTGGDADGGAGGTVENVDIDFGAGGRERPLADAAEEQTRQDEFQGADAEQAEAGSVPEAELESQLEADGAEQAEAAQAGADPTAVPAQQEAAQAQPEPGPADDPAQAGV